MRPKIGLQVILKNERGLIERFLIENEIFTLFSQVVFIDDFSTDGTYEYLLQYLASGKNGVHRNDCLYNRELNLNFSAQRNYANRFLDTDYICRLDLDEMLNREAKDFISHFDGGCDFYTVQRHEYSEGEVNDISEQPFIYKNDPNIFWVYPVHECITGFTTKESLPKDCFLIHNRPMEQRIKYNQWLLANSLEHQRIAQGLPRIARTFNEVISEIENHGGLGMRLPQGLSRIVYGLVRAMRPNVYLDIGTFVGLSALWVAKGMEENNYGIVHTIEIDDNWLDMAKNYVFEAGLNHRINFLRGDCNNILPTLDLQIDLALIDVGNKSLYQSTFETIETKLTDNAIVLAHDIIHPTRVDFVPAWEFKEYMDTRQEYETFIIDYECGLMLIRAR